MSEDMEKKTLLRLMDRNYLDVSRNDGSHCGGIVELDCFTNGEICGVFVTPATDGKTTYVPWHAVSALTVINERSGVGDE